MTALAMTWRWEEQEEEGKREIEGKWTGSKEVKEAAEEAVENYSEGVSEGDMQEQQAWKET